MYNYKLAQKKVLQTQRKQISNARQQRWLKHYNSDVKPKLLQHYDARVNAFIKKIEQAPQNINKIIKKHASENCIPFKFTLKQSRLQSGRKMKSSIVCQNEDPSIWRASKYLPISKYQFRERDKDKEIPRKLNVKSIVYKRWKHERQLIIQNQALKKPTKYHDSKVNSSLKNQVNYLRRQIDDNRSDIPSVQDNVSLRYSVNSQIDNIQKEANQYEKRMEIVEKKSHFKRLAGLEQLINDPKAKKSIRQLLVKQGRARPRIKTQGEEDDTDMLKVLFEKVVKTDFL